MTFIERIASELLKNIKQLQALDGSGDTKEIDHLIIALEASVRQEINEEHARQVLEILEASVDLSALRIQLAQDEYMCERKSAMDYLSSDQMRETLLSEQNKQLIASEVALIRSFNTGPIDACFVGSGPFPMTALALESMQLGGAVTAFDHFEDAVSVSADLLKKCSSKIILKQKNGLDVDYSAYNLIYVAAMVGDKNAVLDKIARTAPVGAVIVARTAERLRTLIYEPIDKARLPKCFELVHKASLSPHFINTTCFFKKLGQGKNERQL